MVAPQLRLLPTAAALGPVSHIYRYCSHRLDYADDALFTRSSDAISEARYQKHCTKWTWTACVLVKSQVRNFGYGSTNPPVPIGTETVKQVESFATWNQYP